MWGLIFLALLPDVQRKIESSLLIGDYNTAIVRSKETFDETPLSYELLLKSLSRGGEESEMLSTWNAFHKKFPKEAMEDQILEELCWGVIRKGQTSTALPTKIITMIGSAITQDIYAVNVLREYIHDSNAKIRGIACELAALFGDETLQEEIIIQYRKENLLEVRLELLKAISALKIKSMIPELKASLHHQDIESAEKKEIVKTLMSLFEAPSQDELQLLAASTWSAERALAASLIREFEMKEEKNLLQSLLKDVSHDVKKEALLTWGYLRLEPILEIHELAKEKDYVLGIVASWILLLNGEEEPLQGWLLHERGNVSLFAAGAVGGGGRYGIPLAKKMLTTSDPYVRANLAFALLKQREMTNESAEILFHFLKTHPEQLSLVKEPFQLLQKSVLKHSPLIPNTPEVMNQVTRLEILNLLAIVEFPEAEKAIREFLKEKRWEVVGVAAETLLGESDETATESLQNLLHDEDQAIRLEAALLLATWGKDGIAIPILLEAYPHALRPMKIKILESLGRLGDRSIIPFLIEQLNSPSQIFRLISASVLIQTLKS